MFFFRTRPKYDVTRTDFRRLNHFQIFAENLSGSEWLASQYPPELVNEIELVEKRLTRLWAKHCLNKLFMPFRLNMLLSTLHLPVIAIPLPYPIDIVGYANSALDEMFLFCETWNVFESKFFWPNSCPRDSVPFTTPNITNSDRLYDEYEHALA